MHSYIINASIQIVPIVNDKHPYEWVDEAISIIEASDLKYEVRPFSTELEGTYTQVVKLFNDMNEHLYTQQCNEWICNLQIQIRSNGHMMGDEKIAKYH